VVLPLIACIASLALADEDTTKAAATRKLLKHKISLDYKEEAISVIVDDIKDQVGKGLSIRLDVKGGLNRNTKVTISKKDAPLEEVLNAICDKNGWGYFIVSKEKNAYDGQLVLKVGKERGYEEGKEPAAKDDKEVKDKGKAKEKAKEKKDTKGKSEPTEKTEPKQKTEPKEKAEPKEKGADDDERAERAATLKLKTAKELIAEEKKDRAKEVLEDLIRKYPRTKAAEEAKELLDKL
jgi:hypothetical protein